MIILSKKAFLKLKYYTLHSKTEISGLGQSRIVSNSTIQIDDVEIFPQTCSGASTVLDEEHLAKFLYQKTINNEDVSNYNVWFHSHHTMPVFWSSTDEETIRNTTSNAYLISLVINKDLEFLTRLDIFKPFRLTIDMPVSSPSKVRNNTKLKKRCIKEIKQCVKTPKKLKLVTKGKKTYLTPCDTKNQLILLESEISDLILPKGWQEWD